MHTAIECHCGNIIVYSMRLAVLECPRCKRRRMQAPSLFSDDGVEAKKLPYLCAEFGNNPIDDCILGAIATSLRKTLDGNSAFSEMYGGEPKPLPETFSVIDGSGKVAEVPVSLSDFATSSTCRLVDRQARSEITQLPKPE